MERLREFLDLVRTQGLAAGRFRGVCHVAVGRRILDQAGQLVSAGITWRELSVLLKDLRYEKELVAELGVDPDDLAPRDRQRFWYSAIALARPDSAEARAEAELVVAAVKPFGYVVGPPPAPPMKSLSSPPLPPDDEPDDPGPVPKKLGGKKK